MLMAHGAWDRMLRQWAVPAPALLRSAARPGSGCVILLINCERCGRSSRRMPMPRFRAGSDSSMPRSDPAATNLVTGLVEALNAGFGDRGRSSAIYATAPISGKKLWTQEAHQADIAAPGLEGGDPRRDDRAAARALCVRAFMVATTGAREPVRWWISCRDICHDSHPFDPERSFADERYQRHPRPCARGLSYADDLAKAAALLRQGGEASDPGWSAACILLAARHGTPGLCRGAMAFRLLRIRPQPLGANGIWGVPIVCRSYISCRAFRAL